MQTLSTATTAKCKQSIKKAGKQRSGQIEIRVKTSKDKEHGESKRQSCFCCGAKPTHPRSQCPAKYVTCHKCGKKGHYKKCCKSKTGKQGTTGEPKQVQVHGLQAPQTEASASRISVRDPPQGYRIMFGPQVPQDNQHKMFHHIQTFHVKSINDTSSKHIEPLWLSTASGGLIYEVECEINIGAVCNVMPLYLHKSLFGDKSLTPTSVQIFGYGESPVANLGACTIVIQTGAIVKDQIMQTLSTATTAKCKQSIKKAGKQRSGQIEIRVKTSKDKEHGRETAQQVGYIAFPEVTPLSLTSMPQIHTSVNALRLDSSKVQKPTCEVLNDAVILNGKRHCLPLTKEYVLSQFRDIFKGIEKLPGGKYHIQLKPEAQPVEHPPRAVPEKKKAAYKEELERLCILGIAI
ncbi:hypothetical protein AWC38_SpisGene18711 [Stylophora pistillata]|uniref:CCHC-type domain-containing protein n=1 Tax=Stylophora pistillata TaxID=50429 RepID=A0A2B4RIH4_STYPI|nr:hypothetical protein AWC38_SpisGene18711 [Stylophora pistillata]